jgi:hypothetical protein
VFIFKEFFVIRKLTDNAFKGLFINAHKHKFSQSHILKLVRKWWPMGSVYDRRR